MRLLLRSSLLVWALLASAASALASEKRDMTGARPDGEIVILGASYAKDWPVKTLAGRPVRNSGVGGDETHGMLARFDKDVIAYRPSVVIIWGFINDIFRSAPETLVARKDAAKKNIIDMVFLARRHGIRPVLATEVTIHGRHTTKDIVMGWIGKITGKRSYAQQINAHVLEMNDWLRQYAADNKLALLDLQPVLAAPDGLRKKEYTQEDGSHLTEAAYDALTRYAEPNLSRLFAFSAGEKATRR